MVVSAFGRGDVDVVTASLRHFASLLQRSLRRLPAMQDLAVSALGLYRESRFSIKAKCRDGEILHRRKTPEAALKKAREMSQTGCYDIHITTPEGRDYHSSEFADLPRTPVARRPSQPSRGGHRSR